MSILILGATGFVGTHVSLALKKEGVDIVLACRNPDRLHPKLNDLEIRIGDINDSVYLNTLFNGIDIVINAFSWTSMFGHARNSHKLLLMPTLDLIDTAKRSGVKRFVNLSSVSVTDVTKKYDPNNDAAMTHYWPHLDNIVRIENYLRNMASENFHVINLRCGHFIGEYYGIGLLPILLPRLNTHLVPWIDHGLTRIPLIADNDIAQAFMRAALTTEYMDSFESFDILGYDTPMFKEVLEFIHDEFGYPLPHFNVSFSIAHKVGYLMELLDPIMPFDPLVTRSIVHLLKETGTTFDKAKAILGYQPAMNWKDAVRRQIKSMDLYQSVPMKMVKGQA